MRIKINAVVLTISDTASRGEREDKSGPAAAEEIRKLPSDVEIITIDIIPDDLEGISDRLRHYADRGDIQLIVTTGGTGLSPRDNTPEATRAVIEREVPGLAEAMRFASYDKTPLATLSRAVCGTRGQTLIINLPGSVKGVQENFEAIRKAIPHAIGIITGQSTKCGG
jgi:molybdenum cofactor synthesis domain-containing protein